MRAWLKRFLQTEASSSMLLLLFAIAAIFWANSSLVIWHVKFVGSTLFWINEGLMSLFFLLVGLELKREFLSGVLSERSQILLPAAAALGGMIIPALVYALINHGLPSSNGWATPVATDIAFALGVLMLFGKRVPTELKVFLLTLAIFDDIGAIIIIAIFYTKSFSFLWFLFASSMVFCLFLCNRANVQTLFVYCLLGACLWFGLLKAGLHPTLAGIILALMIPDGDVNENSLLHRFQQWLHPWVAYLIMPLFALANAGISFHAITWQHMLEPIVLGIACGLFIGKQIGVFGLAALFVRLKYAKLPTNSWLELYGVAVLCGIGFTMSLFLGTLSFQDQSLYLTEVRLGVIIGSILSGLFGVLILLFAFNRQHHRSGICGQLPQ